MLLSCFYVLSGRFCLDLQACYTEGMVDNRNAEQGKSARNRACDVVVVGAGFAGLAAAIEARIAGASVLVIEKMKAPGGNSIISDGGLAAAGTALQGRHGIEDSAELFYRDMLKAGQGLNHPELVRILVEQAAAVFQWTIEYLGVEYLDRVDLFGGHSVARSHAAAGLTGASILKPMLVRLEELGVPVLRSACLTSLMQEGRKVAGIEIREAWLFGKPDSGTSHTIGVNRSMVLAAGGFGADIAFRSVQDPRLGPALDTTNKPSTTAEVLSMALKLGAAPVQLSHIQLGAWASPDEKGFGNGPLFADYIGLVYGILIDPSTGCRFVNECADRKVLSDALLGLGKPGICIADESAVDRSGLDISRALRKHVILTFPSLDSLASHYGIPTRRLHETVQAFNDELDSSSGRLFNRVLPGDAQPIATPPYYAMRLWPKVHYTMGGLQIDSRARVIDLEHRPIPGLYAAGEITGGVHGASRLGSCAITDCLVFGRIAGRQAAAGSAARG
jgi:flavocytochrome c